MQEYIYGVRKENPHEINFQNLQKQEQGYTVSLHGTNLPKLKEKRKWKKKIVPPVRLELTTFRL